ncbi:segregation and condensation protein A [Candidatus Ruminimicrobiellum ovillum]|uniref:segregation and condensation protein A n=1 Tax=Candidatus Ruminimicrobiellum ovillum TaxID=1947927 RepID=UPI00355A6FB0
MEYDVHLDTFEGPLDLLLHLVRKTDLEIQEIQVSEITTEYLAYLDTIQNLDLDTAGDFLVMASTLMQIKAKMLHPDNEKDKEDADTELDKIKERLLEYQKYKEVSKLLSNKEQEYSQTYYRPEPVIPEQEYEIDATIYDLVKSFQNALRTLPEEVREIMYKEIPIETKIREILDILEGKQYLTFSEIAKIQTSRSAMVVCFMAVLELVKNKQVVAKQSELFEDIRIYRVYNDEENESIVKETRDELSLEIEKNIPEQEEPVVRQEVPFKLEAESVNSQNKDIGVTDGN